VITSIFYLIPHSNLTVLSTQLCCATHPTMTTTVLLLKNIPPWTFQPGRFSKSVLCAISRFTFRIFKSGNVDATFLSCIHFPICVSDPQIGICRFCILPANTSLCVASRFSDFCFWYADPNPPLRWIVPVLLARPARQGYLQS
jgi:hypothetical protein